MSASRDGVGDLEEQARQRKAKLQALKARRDEASNVRLCILIRLQYCRKTRCQYSYVYVPVASYLSLLHGCRRLNRAEKGASIVDK